MSTTQPNSGQLRIRTKMRSQTVAAIYYQGQMVPFLLRGGKIVHAARPLKLHDCAFRIISDDQGDWFEFGFLSAHQLTGDPATGWTDPGNYLRIIPENSFDLVNWSQGDFIPAPSSPVIDNGDGTYWYWARSTWPKLQRHSLMDFNLLSTRGQKSITSLSLFSSPIALPNFPYDIEADMPLLQADLRAAGHPAAIATYTPAPYTAEIKRHYLGGQDVMGPTIDHLQVTHSGESVTQVTSPEGTVISLPNLPYALPTDAALLQADLIAAGYSGTVVRLFAGQWRIHIPDVTNSSGGSSFRNLIATFTPGDPAPYWDADGVYQGLLPDNTETQPYTNLRTITGQPVNDAAKRQFCRLNLTAGARFGGRNTLLGLLLNHLKTESTP